MRFQKLTAAVLAAALGAAPVLSQSIPASAATTPWGSAYRTALQNFAYEFANGTEEVYWDLTDLDADGVPELLIADGSYHVSAVCIYYFDGSKAVPVDSDGDGDPDRFGSWGQASFCPETHTILSGYTGMGYTNIDYYEYTDHKIVHKLSIADNIGAVEKESEYEYTVNSHTVTKAEYDKAVAPYDAMYWVALGQSYPYKDTSALDEPELWRIYYKQLLNSTYSDPEDMLTTAKYSVADLFGSNIPELLISGGEYHAAGVNVYTIRNHVPVRIGTFGEWGLMAYDFTSGELISSYFGMGYSSSSRYRYQNGTLTETFSREDNSGTGETPVYYKINGAEVSETEYNSVIADYANNMSETFGRDFLTTNLLPIDSFQLAEEVELIGDLDGDGIVNAGDAADILIAAAAIGAGSQTVTEELLRKGDINGDGEISAVDAAAILQYSAAVGAGAKEILPTDFV